MSNYEETSDKNVVSEDDIKALKKDLFYYDELKEQYDDDTVKFYEALRHILTEREQDKKRIQELEEESRKKSIELICYQEELENSIPKQVIENKIEELKKDYDKKYDLFMGYKCESREQQDILKQMGILQELLEDK